MKEDTIYRDEAGFDNNFKLNINFAEMEFEETLNVSEASSIFRVNYYGKPRVLKVVRAVILACAHAQTCVIFLIMLAAMQFHNNGDPGYARDRIRDLSRSRCEIRA